MSYAERTGLEPYFGKLEEAGASDKAVSLSTEIASEGMASGEMTCMAKRGENWNRLLEAIRRNFFFLLKGTFREEWNEIKSER